MITLAEVRLTRTELVRIVAAGAAAQRAGRPATDCPFDPGSGDAAERVRAQAWIRGWVKADRATR